ncbi:Rid family detoxifying hydrolase [soil metagenome]
MATKFLTEIPGYAGAHSPYSHAVVANGFVFVSGQIAVRPGGEGPLDIVGTTIEEQTRQALINVDLVLRAAGSSLENSVKLTILLARPDEYKEMNATYAEFFQTNKPARSIAQLGANVPGVLISVDAIATLNGTDS